MRNYRSSYHLLFTLAKIYDLLGFEVGQTKITFIISNAGVVVSSCTPSYTSINPVAF